MKKALILAIAVALFATPSFGAITDSAHDLSLGSGNTNDVNTGTNTQLCVYCHTPHKADISVTTAPLWNRTNTVATGAVYVGLDLQAAANGYDLAGINGSDAPLCLACHDGTVTEALFNPPNSGTIILTDAETNFSTDAIIGGLADDDMNNDHPIGFDFTATAIADDEINLKAAVEVGAMAGAVSYGVGNNEMWCSSCHDVHDNTNAPFLRTTNAGSALCLACHAK